MGGALGIMREMFPPKPTWDPQRDMPDQSGKVVLITGGNSGMGKEATKHLLRKNAKVYIACRDESRAKAAIEEIKSETGKEPLFIMCDLASLASVKQAADDFKAKEPALHVLYNSGGVQRPPIDNLSVEGFDLTFATNVLGHGLLTMLLIDQLEAGAKSSNDGKARVVNVASSGAYVPPAKGGIDFASLRDGSIRRKISPMDLYAQSKYANYVFSVELAKRVADKGIISNSLNPGNIRTGLYRDASAVETFILRYLTYPLEYGPLTMLYVGTTPEAGSVNGEWFAPWGRQVKFCGPIVDGLGPALWEWIEEQCKHYLP